MNDGTLEDWDREAAARALIDLEDDSIVPALIDRLMVEMESEVWNVIQRGLGWRGISS